MNRSGPSHLPKSSATTTAAQEGNITGSSPSPSPVQRNGRDQGQPQTGADSTPTATPQDFFTRNGLSPQLDRVLCDDIAQSLFPHHETSRHAWQGWCSYSVLASPRRDLCPGNEGHAFLVQFRPPQYAVDVDVMDLAGRVYGGEVVPRVVRAGSVMLWPRAVPPAREFLERAEEGEGEEGLGLRLEVCAMTMVRGTPYGVVQVRRRVLAEREVAWQREVVRGFAEFMARGWVEGRKEEAIEMVGKSRSRLHAATPGKLEVLSRELPRRELRDCVARVLRRYRELGLDVLPGRQRERSSLVPFTLNHGDIVPGNILVDGETGKLNGLVDWAEAEVGLWGLGSYGLEFLLGYVTSPLDSGEQNQEQEREVGDNRGDVAWEAGGTARASPGKSFAFTYYEQASELRTFFWEEVKRNIGRLVWSLEVEETVHLIRDIGVLLWFGYAWDEGRIDRVVSESRDPRELLLLETFLRLGSGVGGGSEKARL